MGIFKWLKGQNKMEEEILRGAMRRIFADVFNISADEIDPSRIAEFINRFDNETKQGWLKIIADIGEKKAAVELGSVFRETFKGKASESDEETLGESAHPHMTNTMKKSDFCVQLLRQSNFTLKQLDCNDTLSTERNAGGHKCLLMVLRNKRVAEQMENPVIDKFLLTMPDSDKHRPFIVLIIDGVIDVFDCDKSQTIFDSV